MPISFLNVSYVVNQKNFVWFSFKILLCPLNIGYISLRGSNFCPFYTGARSIDVISCEFDHKTVGEHVRLRQVLLYSGFYGIYFLKYANFVVMCILCVDNNIRKWIKWCHYEAIPIRLLKQCFFEWRTLFCLFPRPTPLLPKPVTYLNDPNLTSIKMCKKLAV